jgi:pantothenate synthetase
MSEWIADNATKYNFELQESTIAQLRNELAVARRNEELYKKEISVAKALSKSLEKQLEELQDKYDILKLSQSINNALEIEIEKQDNLIRDLTETIIKIISLIE